MNTVKWMWVGIISIMAFSAQADSVKGVDVSAVQKALKTANAKWTAKESWVTRLSREEANRLLGNPDAPDGDVEFTLGKSFRSQGVQSISNLGALPSEVDWRNKDQVNWVSPILNQGNCGSCVAFASVATLETQVNITSGIPGLDPSFSTQALFVCGGGACQFGWMPGLAAKQLETVGVPDAACAPYTMGATGETVSCKSICSDSASRTTKIVSSTRPTKGASSVEDVKAALTHGPLLTAMMVYEDFLTYSSGVYKHTTGTTLGGHAVSIVGYDDNLRAWIIRNSWGKEWGEQGFAKISWDDVSGVGNTTWLFEVAKNEGYISVRNPKGRPFQSGTFDLESESTFPQTSKIDFTLIDSQGRIVKQMPCPAGLAKCQISLESPTLADGLYEVYATATWKNGSNNSMHEDFYVLNHENKLDLNFAPKGFDPAQPQKGRIEFTLTSDMAPVPLSGIGFTVTDSTGKTVYTKHADLVVPKMTMGWRTITVPNGHYDVWFTGEMKTAHAFRTIDTAKMSIDVKN